MSSVLLLSSLQQLVTAVSVVENVNINHILNILSDGKPQQILNILRFICFLPTKLCNASAMLSNIVSNSFQLQIAAGKLYCNHRFYWWQSLKKFHSRLSFPLSEFCETFSMLLLSFLPQLFSSFRVDNAPQ